MDPDANRAEQIRLAYDVIRRRDKDIPLDEDDVDRLAELVIALDEWILRGGFLPSAWHRSK